ncbi:unnamed protein product [Notodromas monacha]|uniref:Uncharacterized protein n=1 Tax=Notodromas monacha TaxID=399045 RepID=A0A7R9BJV0_9CRUS|nr:unnamed protein product [Notodromas monacha]CAG0915711.1 unnamed protein product [Notodromas monacha]
MFVRRRLSKEPRRLGESVTRPEPWGGMSHVRVAQGAVLAECCKPRDTDPCPGSAFEERSTQRATEAEERQEGKKTYCWVPFARPGRQGATMCSRPRARAPSFAGVRHTFSRAPRTRPQTGLSPGAEGLPQRYQLAATAGMWSRLCRSIFLLSLCPSVAFFGIEYTSCGTASPFRGVIMGRLRGDAGSALAVRYRKLLESESDYGVNEECLNIVEPADWRDFLVYSCIHCGTVEKLKHKPVKRKAGKPARSSMTVN